MLVHSNPMIRHSSGVWEDSKLGRVQVKSFRVNWGNHRQRWGIFERQRRGAPLMLVSRHITESQAVVLAQRLANRLQRQAIEKDTAKKTRRKNRSSDAK